MIKYLLVLTKFTYGVKSDKKELSYEGHTLNEPRKDQSIIVEYLEECKAHRNSIAGKNIWNMLKQGMKVK